MDNVVSIFTGQQPCEYLHVDHEKFRQYFNQNWAGTHMWDCQDCLKRWTNSNRNILADAIEQKYSTVVEEQNEQ